MFSKRSMLLVAVPVLLAFAGCTPPPVPAPKSPTIDRAAEEAAVRATAQKWRDAISVRDVDLILSFYADDAWQMPENGEIARTPEQRRTYWQAIAHLPIVSDTVDVADRVEIANTGDLAVQYGEFRQVMSSKNEPYKSIPQKFLNTWRKMPDGSWKVSASMATVRN